MKSKDILSVLSLIDPDEILGQKETKNKPRLGRFIKIAAAAACFCLVLSAGILFLPKMMPQQDDIPQETDASDVPGYAQLYPGDTRDRNNKNALEQNSAIVWPWNCREIYNQFFNMKYNGKEFISRSANLGEEIPVDMIEKKLGEAICYGQDIYTETIHETGCEVYEISGVDSSRIVAVKYNGHNAYYPFICEEYNPPRTFGELASALNLSENVSLREFYYNIDVVNSERYGLSPAGSNKLWEAILHYASDAECLDMYEVSYNVPVISFSLNSDVLGVHNLGLSLNKQGYLITNIEGYGYYYYIGEEAVNSITEVAMENKTNAPIHLKFFLSGTVTEIGEDYIKVDDSVMMKNPDDGIEFTVYANHMNIKRYIISGFLKVGETVTVEYSDMLTPENHTEIKNATNMYEAIITDSGQVLIPE